MSSQTRSITSTTASAAIEVDWRRIPFGIGFGVTLTAGATLTYTVEHTFDDPNSASPTYFSHETVTGIVDVDADGNYAFPVRGIRLNASAYTDGTATLTLLQGDIA